MRFCMVIDYAGIEEVEVACFSPKRLPQKRVSRAPKKNPEADYAPGSKCWGRAAGVGGMEAARSGLFSNLKREGQRNVRRCGNAAAVFQSHRAPEAEHRDAAIGPKRLAGRSSCSFVLRCFRLKTASSARRTQAGDCILRCRIVRSDRARRYVRQDLAGLLAAEHLDGDHTLAALAKR